jgi:hypothetical protein
VLTSDCVFGQRYVVPKSDRVTTSYTCTAAKSTSSNHKVRDITLGRARCYVTVGTFTRRGLSSTAALALKSRGGSEFETKSTECDLDSFW